MRWVFYLVFLYCTAAELQKNEDICELLSNKSHSLTTTSNERKVLKIFDCFLFNDETDMLEIRLRELGSVVDYFVLLESSKTFSNQPKRLIFNDMKERYQIFANQIIYLSVETLPAGNSWKKEAYLRDYLFHNGLQQKGREARKGDIIIVSDVDELIRPVYLHALKICTNFNPSLIQFTMQFNYYSYSNRVLQPWLGVFAVAFDESNPNISVHALRQKHSATLTIDDAGWHCSYCFNSLKQFRNKFNSFAHTEFSKKSAPKIHTKEHLIECIQHGRDILGPYRQDKYPPKFENLAVVDAPAYVLANSMRFRYLLNRSTPDAGLIDAFD